MRYWCSKLVLALAVLLLPAFPVYGFEPHELLQRDQEDRLRVELSGRYFLLNDQAVQIGKSSPNALSQFDTRLQYRLFENPGWGKFECYLGFSLLTHWDVPDRLDFAKECGYTFLETVRLEIGHLNMLNIGAAQPGRGLSAYWLGGSGRIMSTKSFELDSYVRYFPKSNLPAAVSGRLKPSKEPLMFEGGLRAEYRAMRHLSLFAALYGYFDDSFTLARIGAYPGVQYYIGEHLRFIPDNISVEVSGNASANTKVDQKESAVWFRLIWSWK